MRVAINVRVSKVEANEGCQLLVDVAILIIAQTKVVLWDQFFRSN